MEERPCPKGAGQNLRALWGPLALGAGLLVALSLRYWQFTVDDAYISLRYARNLLAGHGLVFNIGERVEGFTNLTWTLLSAGILRLGLPPVPTLKIVGLICALVTVWICLLLFRHLQPGRGPFAWLLSFIIAGAPCIVAWSVGGLETMLFAAMLSGTFYAYVSGKTLGTWPVWPILALFATLTRPEGLLIVPILVIHGAVAQSGKQRRQSRQAAVIFALLFGAFLVWRLAYYGDIVPNTYHAKVAGGGVQAVLGGARYLIEFGRSYCGPVALGLIGICLVMVRRGRSVPLLLVTVAAYFLTPLKLGSDWMPQFRYLAPYWPLAAVLIAVGAARMAELVGTVGLARSRRATQLIVAGLVLGAFALLYSYQVVLAYNPGGKRYGHYGISVDYHGASVEKYARGGERLAQIAQPGDTLAAFAIGAMGYHCDIHIIDIWGLVDRGVARHPWPERLSYVLSLEPTYIEDLSTEATTTGMTQLPEFQRNYQPLGDGLIESRIFVRKDAHR